MLTILNELSKHHDPEANTFDLDVFKCIYIAPMKALVQEMVAKFSECLNIFSVKVDELTGDAQMTKQQIAETQVIVTTPEKWTHKQTDTSYTNLVRLDKIHLLCHMMSAVL